MKSTSTLGSMPATHTEEPNQPQRLNRRREARLSTSQAAQLFWSDDVDDLREETVRIVNVSLSGLAFITRVPFRPERTVTLRTARETLECVVRYSKEVNGRRHVGVEILTRTAREGEGSLARLARALRRT